MSESGVALLAGGFLMGLVGSGHCLSMCGGIASAFGVRNAIPGVGSAAMAVLYSLGRVSIYMVLGAAAGAVGWLADLALAVGPFLRLAAALIVLAVGFQLLGLGRGMVWIERAGRPLWRVASKRISQIGRVDRIWKALALGGLWGLLPCGLVYAAVTTASAAGTVWGGATFMLFFGLGTLPAMTFLAGAAGGMSRHRMGVGVQRFVGGVLVVFGLVAVLSAVVPMGSHAEVSMDTQQHGHMMRVEESEARHH